MTEDYRREEERDRHQNRHDGYEHPKQDEQNRD